MDVKRLMPCAVVAAVACGIAAVLVARNGSLIACFEQLDKFGDQHHYLGLSKNLLHRRFEPHLYSVGYSIFLLPFLAASPSQEWAEVVRGAVAVQSFILLPLSWGIITSLFAGAGIAENPHRGRFALIIAAFLAYELFLLRRSASETDFYLFFGLIPYSEPLVVFLFCLLSLIMVRGGMAPGTGLAFIAGALASSIVATRMVVLILVAPAVIFFLPGLIWKRCGSKVALAFAAGLLLAYAPQLFYNWKAYHRPLVSSHCRYWPQVASMYADTIRQLYGVSSTAIFSCRYCAVNVVALAKNYLHFLILAIANIAVIARKRGGRRTMTGEDAFFMLSNCCALLYIGLVLAYWWSPLSDCINRFLMPLAWVSLINLSHSVSLTGRPSAERA
jgi:hypothetical protein